MKRLLNIFGLGVNLILLVFMLRRILYTLAILRPRPRRGSAYSVVDLAQRWPDVLILAPCRDEQDMIADLCAALARLDYPSEKRRVVLINDGSHDQTGERMAEFSCHQPGWHVLSLPRNLGKSKALNAALERFGFGEIVYIFDADHRPEPSALKQAVRYFDDPRVAGVSGRTIPSNPLASPSAYYSSVENLVNQMMTMRAKDRLGLAPALLGSNCGYRRTLLAQCGGFREGALSEDSDLTLVLYRAGYYIRFAEDAKAYHQVPESINGYLKQHTRWARGLNDVARLHLGDLGRRNVPLWRRLDLFLFALGYLDRIATLAAIILVGLSRLDRQSFQFRPTILYFALLTPFAQISTLFAEQRVSPEMWLRLPLLPIFFGLDIAGTAQAMLDTLLNRTPVWTKTQRGRLGYSSNDKRP